MIFTESGIQAKGGGGIWRLRIQGDQAAEPEPFLETPETETNGHVSPDGKWIAYELVVSGRDEVYVQPFPGPGPRHQISTSGASGPQWSRDGRELYYIAGDSLMVMDVAASQGFTAGAPRVLYDGRYRAAQNANSNYDVAKDGRFLHIQQVQPDRAVTSIDVVLNWFTELARAASAK